MESNVADMQHVMQMEKRQPASVIKVSRSIQATSALDVSVGYVQCLN